jgi:hypothetical protein
MLTATVQLNEERLIKNRTRLTDEHFLEFLRIAITDIKSNMYWKITQAKAVSNISLMTDFVKEIYWVA